MSQRHICAEEAIYKRIAALEKLDAGRLRKDLDIVVKRVDAAAKHLVLEINDYFASTPVGDISEDRLDNWRALRTVDCEWLELFWSKIDDEPLDYFNCAFQDIDENGCTGKGMKRLLKAHGPSRYVNNKSGNIVAGTYKNHKLHGLFMFARPENI